MNEMYTIVHTSYFNIHIINQSLIKSTRIYISFFYDPILYMLHKAEGAEGIHTGNLMLYNRPTEV